jgi:putative FmdB family regulatory protein
MPTYEYRCAKCGEELEVFQTFAEAPLTKHKGCGGKLAKVLSPAGIVLKGSGFYKTDNRSSSSKRSASKDSAKSESGSSDTSSGSSGDAKSSSSDSGSSGSDKKSGSDSGSSGGASDKKPAAKTA